jgi:hypothetical protein
MWERACVDAASVPNLDGGEHTAVNLSDRGRLESKTPFCRRCSLAFASSSDLRAPVHESRFLIQPVRSIPAANVLAGRARKRSN